MNILEKYKGNFKARMFRKFVNNRDEYYLQVALIGQDFEKGVLILPDDLKYNIIDYYNNVNPEFLKKLESAVFKMSKGELKSDNLESFLLKD